jgi:PAS domain S-box-containing protein
MFATLNQLSHHAAWRRQLEMLLESAGEGIYGIDLAGRCIFINRAGAELLGYTPDEVLGRQMHYLIHHSHGDGAPMAVDTCRIFRSFRESRGVRVDDEVLWRRDGSAFPAEYASYPIREGGEVVGAVVTFSDITERKRTEAALQLAREELERRVVERTQELSAAHLELREAHDGLLRLSAHLTCVREEERAHIARELHDALGASLTAMQLELNWLRQRLATHTELLTHIDGARAIGTTAMEALRRLLNDLRPGVLDHLGLWAALESLLEETQTRANLVCTLSCPAVVEECRLGREAEIAVYRIVQEVLTNIQRHAAARHVWLEAKALGTDLVILIRDDGRGMQVPERPSSFGLLGMHERARAIGGTLRIQSRPGAGTQVSLRLPHVLLPESGWYEGMLDPEEHDAIPAPVVHEVIQDSAVHEPTPDPAARDVTSDLVVRDAP